MPQQPRNTLKSYFQTGDRPTQAQFAELIDSFLNKKEDEVIVDGNKNIGIGFPLGTSLTAKLEVDGDIKATNLLATNGITAPNLQLTSGGANGDVLTSDGSGNGSWMPIPSAPPTLWTEGGSNIYRSGGNVGIGLNNPTEKLEVNGTVKASGLQLTTGVASGRVLMSDTDGVGSWQALSIPPQLWSQSGSNIYRNTGNVGIGVSSPSAKLAVSTGSGNPRMETNGRSLEFFNTGNSVFIGEGAGASDDLSNNNVFVGYQAGYSNTTGYSNIFLGRSAGYSNTTGYSNTFLGLNAGSSNTTGSSNTFLGRSAGFSNTTGSSNTFFGFYAGFSETGSNKLYISNSSTSTPLIYGDFDSGTVEVNGAVVQTSDQKMKKNIAKIPSLLQKIKQLNPVSYLFKSEKRKGKNIGFIAQEIRTIFPEVVVERAIKDITEADHQEMEKLREQMEKAANPKRLQEKLQQKLKSIPMTSILGIKYLEIIPIAIKGIQEQQELIESLQARVKALEAQ